MTTDNPIRSMTVLEYMDAVQAAIEARKPHSWPETRDQLAALLERYPDRGRICLPARDGLPGLGLPRNYGRVATLPLDWQESFLATLSADSDFRDAVITLVGGAC